MRTGSRIERVGLWLPHPEQAYSPPEPQQTILFPHRMG